MQSYTVYNAEAADLDLIVRGDAVDEEEAVPARPQVWGVGNNGLAAEYDDEEGYYSVHASAKNTIALVSTAPAGGLASMSKSPRSGGIAVVSPARTPDFFSSSLGIRMVM